MAKKGDPPPPNATTTCSYCGRTCGVAEVDAHMNGCPQNPKNK